MANASVDELTSRAMTAMSRRTSLLGFGAAALASTLIRSAPARAGKVGKKAKKKCRRQIAQCDSSIATLCATPAFASQGLEVCEAALVPCCGSFEGCHVDVVMLCLADGIEALRPPPA